MKKLCIYFFLVLLSFQTSSWADDIQDFQIEGMSIGDSALDYFSKEEITKAIRENQYPGKDGKFIEIQFHHKTDSFLKTFEGLQIIYKKNDKNYKIYSLTGGLFFGSDINACLEKQKIVEKDLSILFKNTERQAAKEKYTWDKTGKSYIHFIVHYFDTEDQIEITCYEFAKHLNAAHYLAVAVDTKEFMDWVE